MFSITILLFLGLHQAFGQSPFWQQVGRLDTNTVFTIVASPKGELYAGTGGGAIFKSTDRGLSWIQSDSGLSGSSVGSICLTSSGDMFAGTGSGVFRSTSGGSAWITVNNVIPNFQSSISLIISFGSDTLLCCAERDPYTVGIFRSTNSGGVWSEVYGMSLRRVIGFACDDSSYMYAGLSPNPFEFGSMIRSSDGGQTWHNLGLSSSESGQSVIFVNGDLFCGGIVSILRSPDRGTTWSSVLGGGGINASSLVANKNGHIFAATYRLGVFRSTNGGQTWDSVNTGLDLRNIYSLAIDSTGFIYAGTQSGAIFRSVESTTSVQLIAGRPPYAFSLHQNYPNPFNPTTTISFSLPSRLFVSLKVFDALGREVSVLVSEELRAGTYSQKWNAASMPSGVYFYRMLAGSYRETKKLVLLR